MIADWFVSMIDRKRFSVRVHPAGQANFEIESDDTRAMISLLLRRQRQQSGLTLEEVARSLGAKSRNAYARYEQGVSAPTLQKLDELLRAISPKRGLVLKQSDAA